MENEKITRKEQREYKRELEAKNPEVFAVLKAAFHQFKPKHGRPHGGPNQPPNGMGIRPSGGFPGDGQFGPFRPRGPFRE
ncbi:unnamed protein product [Nippostrongylus brasiliensis]|uniref:DUF5302 domain-containing protein n=1 Tax=Nippostrongylus brasiliensis TaxID=27835 RepID=A0A0N4XQ12_NIPBR|nr:unnamed protein product [Nippostrongylus brasiliensis]